MIITNEAALVDNDFICHISESKLPENDICNALEIIMKELDRYAIIHILVKQKELDISSIASSKPVIKLLFSKNIISEATFSDIFDGDTAKQSYYEFLIQDFFSILNPDEQMVLNSKEDVLTYWRTGKSLGEIHSLVTCIVCGCGIFFSDDSDSKRIAEYIKQKYMGDINVLNRSELVNTEKIKAVLDRKTRKSLSHSAH